MNILFAILVQAPYKPQPMKLPESNVVIERFMLKGQEPDESYLLETKFF